MCIVWACRVSRVSCGAAGWQCLRPLTWLNDEVVNMYMELLAVRDKEVSYGRIRKMNMKY